MLHLNPKLVSLNVVCLLLCFVICYSVSGKSQTGQKLAFEEVLNELNLRTEQKNEVTRILDKEKKDLNALKKELMNRQIKLDTLLSSDSASDQEIVETRNLVDEIENQMNHLKEQNRLAVKRLLTPEQRKQLYQIQFNN